MLGYVIAIVTFGAFPMSHRSPQVYCRHSTSFLTMPPPPSLVDFLPTLQIRKERLRGLGKFFSLEKRNHVSSLRCLLSRPPTMSHHLSKSLRNEAMDLLTSCGSRILSPLQDLKLARTRPESTAAGISRCCWVRAVCRGDF